MEACLGAVLSNRAKSRWVPAEMRTPRVIGILRGNKPATIMAMRGQGKQGANLASRACEGGEGAMAFGVGDAVRLKAGGGQMTVSKLFKSPEGCEMVQCTWFDKKSRVHRAEFVMDSLEVADAIMLRLMQGERA